MVHGAPRRVGLSFVRPFQEELMNRLHCLRNPLSILTSLIVVACSAEPNDDSIGAVAEQESALKNFCGNNRCDHQETCSTCPQDCGSCTAGTGGGGSGGTGGTGGGSSICGSTAAPPAHYTHVVVFSF